MRRALSSITLVLICFLSLSMSANALVIIEPEPIDITLSQTVFVKGHMKGSSIVLTFDLESDLDSEVSVVVLVQHRHNHRAWMQYSYSDVLDGSMYEVSILIDKRMPAGLYDIEVHIWS